MASPDLTPKLLLFLSVDLSGSTAFKLSHPAEGTVEPWLLAFKTFYARFSDYLAKACGRNAVPALWKCLGDELVFHIRLARSADALIYISALRQAVREYNEFLQQKKLPLKLQNTAWLAGFPVGNAEVRVMDYAQRGTARVDFIGPLMDIGFRLARFSTPRKFVVAVDLALMLLQTTNSLRFHFDNEELLKGVLKNQPYPLIWIDMLDHPNEDDQKLRVPPNANDLKLYCERYIRETQGAIMRPFINGDHDFNTKPAEWSDKYKKACALLRADEEPIRELAKQAHAKGDKKATISRTKKKSRELLQMAKKLSKPRRRKVQRRNGRKTTR